MAKIMYNKMNLDFARSTYRAREPGPVYVYKAHVTTPAAYAPAYTVSNEDLRYTAGMMRDSGHKVLTVAGSGDHALFYALNGAKKIDTFDITFCAKAIMDIKTAAIRSGIPYEQYIKMSNDLHYSASAINVPGMREIMPNIPSDSAKFIRGMDGYLIFSNGYPIYNNTTTILTESEYKKLQSQITKPFNFIWSDIADLHAHLWDEYDVINLSNIFEWYPDIIIPTLQKLRNHVRPGGHILLQSGNSVWHNKNAFIRAQMRFKRWARIMLDNANSQCNVAILKRIR